MIIEWLRNCFGFNKKEDEQKEIKIRISGHKLSQMHPGTSKVTPISDAITPSSFSSVVQKPLLETIDENESEQISRNHVIKSPHSPNSPQLTSPNKDEVFSDKSFSSQEVEPSSSEKKVVKEFRPSDLTITDFVEEGEDEDLEEEDIKNLQFQQSRVHFPAQNKAEKYFADLNSIEEGSSSEKTIESPRASNFYKANKDNSNQNSSAHL